MLVLLVGKLIVQHLGPYLSAMDRVTVMNYCLGLLGLLLLQGVLNVEGRSIFNTGKCIKWNPFRLNYTACPTLVPSLV